MINLLSLPPTAVFVPSARHQAAATGTDGLLLLVLPGRLLYTNDNESQWTVPELRDYPELAATAVFCGNLERRPCYAVAIAPENVPVGLVGRELRDIIHRMTPGIYAAVSRGSELTSWLQSRRFCGSCGAPLEFSSADMSRGCPRCHSLSYPVLAPAVITAVTRNGQLLLAANKRFQNGIHSLIAGFVECGESLEEAVRREIREEVSIEVKNVQYFSSQTWPFPSSLMVGFTAEYADGKLRPDGVEIIAADWYRPGTEPPLPGPGSIARRLIDATFARLR